MNLRYKLIGFSAPILALSLSVFITSLILTAIGKDPIETFILMYDYGTTGKSLVSVFNRFIPLYFLRLQLLLDSRWAFSILALKVNTYLVLY